MGWITMQFICFHKLRFLQFLLVLKYHILRIWTFWNLDTFWSFSSWMLFFRNAQIQGIRGHLRSGEWQKRTWWNRTTMTGNILLALLSLDFCSLSELLSIMCRYLQYTKKYVVVGALNKASFVGCSHYRKVSHSFAKLIHGNGAGILASLIHLCAFMHWHKKRCEALIFKQISFLIFVLFF